MYTIVLIKNNKVEQKDNSASKYDACSLGVNMVRREHPQMNFSLIHQMLQINSYFHCADFALQII